MLAEERFSMILQLLKEKRTATVGECSEITGASEATVRRDLNLLHKQGKLIKVHGGATLLDNTFVMGERDVTTKSQMNVEEKKRIAALAADQIEEEDFVFLDAGTTTIYMADYINVTSAVYVTTGVDLARRLMEKGLRVFVIGGQLKPGTEAIMGSQAVESMSRYNFTKAFLGMNGVSVRAGFTTPDPEEAMTKATAMERSYITYILADHTKFGKVSSVTVAPLSGATIITDKLADDVYREHTTVKEVAQE